MSNTFTDRASRNRSVVVASSMHMLRTVTETVALHVSMSSSVTLHSMAKTVRATAVSTPASLVGEDGIDELSTTHVVLERSMAVQGNMVEAEIPDSGEGHSVGGESKDSTNDGAGKDIVEMVVLVDSKGTTDQNSTEDRSVGSDQLPHGWVVVGKDLELGVEVQVQVDKAGKGSGGVSTGHGLESIVDLALVTSADIGSVVELQVSLVVVSSHGARSLHVRLADLEEVRSETTNKPLDEDLENSSGDERVEKTDGGIVEVPETADTDLHHQEDEDGDQSSQQSSSPDRDDLSTERVSVLGPDNFAVVEGDREGSCGCGLSEVDTKANSTHNSHGDNVEPCVLDPLSERGLSRHGKRIMVCLLATTHLGAVCVSVGSLFLTREDTHVVGDKFFNDVDEW